MNLHTDSDRRLNIMLGISLVIAATLVVIAFVAVPKVLSSSSTVEAVKDGNEQASCRAQFRGQVDDATANLTAAKAELDVLTNRGLEASARQDHDTLTALLPQLEPARQKTVDLAERLKVATNRYQDLLKMSRTDPDQFIVLCHRL